MGGHSPDKLFLLEFLVDKVSLKEYDAKRYEKRKYYSLLVTVKIEDLLCLDINQDAMKKEETHFGVTWHFCCGKSCTFAMQPRKLLNLLRDHPCYFIVGLLDNRKMSSEILGASKGNICSDLSDVILRAEIKRDKYPIISAVHQDTYNLRSPLGEDVGFVSILVRLTCYGQAVFTRFTCIDGDNKVYMYENKDPDPCAEKESDKEDEESLEFVDSDNALEIFKEADKHICIFDRDRQTESYKKDISISDKPPHLQEGICSANPNVPKPDYGQKTIVCTNIAELLPESTFQRRFPDDTVPVAPLLSSYEDENPDNDQECTCLREMQLNEICRTMFLRDRLSPHEKTEETPVVKPDTGVYHPSHPPIRYDTTSRLTAAYGGQRPVPLNALVEVEDEKKILPNPPVRYDTTGALSPAFQGAPFEEEEPSSSSTSAYEETELLYPCVQYSPSSVTCRCWCPCNITQMPEDTPDSGPPYHPLNPPIRYDTTSSLTAASEGRRPVPLNDLVEVEEHKKDLPNPPVRYDTTGALSPAYQGGDGGGGGSGDGGGVAGDIGGGGDVIIDIDYKKRAKGFAITCDTEVMIPIPSVAFPNAMTVPWKKSRRYNYKLGDRHPGVKIGHSNCVPEFIEVPERVGWLWKLYSLPGWKPGALRTTLKDIFRELRLAAGMEEKRSRASRRPKSRVSKGKAQSKASKAKSVSKGKGKGEDEKAKKVISKISPIKGQSDDKESGGKRGKKKKSKQSVSESEPESEVELPPTLHIHEQDGNYYIAMQPVNLYPENANIPLQFRIPIPKSKPDKEEEESVISSELRLDYQAPAVYWPAKPRKKTIEIQCDPSELPDIDGPSIEFIMEPKQTGDKDKKGRPRKGSNVGNSQVTSWDKDPATAVGKVR